jgi:hypothetical protein
MTCSQLTYEVKRRGVKYEILYDETAKTYRPSPVRLLPPADVQPPQ